MKTQISKATGFCPSQSLSFYQLAINYVTMLLKDVRKWERSYDGHDPFYLFVVCGMNQWSYGAMVLWVSIINAFNIWTPHIPRLLASFPEWRVHSSSATCLFLEWDIFTSWFFIPWCTQLHYYIIRLSDEYMLHYE